MGGNRKSRPDRKPGRTTAGRVKGRAAKNRNRKAPGPTQEILYGYHSVYEALRSGRRQFDAVLLSDRRSDPRVEKVGKLAQAKGIPLQDADLDTLERLAQGGNHQGIAARVSVFPVKPVEDIWAELRNRETPFFILMAESIEDPHNLGALIRTALCADVDYIVVPKDRSALPTPAVSRTSAGAMEHADIFVATNLAALMRDLKKEGAWISGLDAGGDKELFDADLTGNLVLVVGGEHKGIRPGVRKECDFILSIPISGKVNSLNASVAGGVAMYEARRQRGYGN
ncbi:MAG TPA: 23S rRNA (guanosine(2251)-2'-O)-methyltransferase RlmB [Desulfobacteraceae bacterium]|nr:23S rRNA (guanosine(2251)-2'-O)-methyltransferase RlmB [Desulfobacteraceae bacterium]